jgi:hypothetical protein
MGVHVFLAQLGSFQDLFAAWLQNKLIWVPAKQGHDALNKIGELNGIHVYQLDDGSSISLIKDLTFNLLEKLEALAFGATLTSTQADCSIVSANTSRTQSMAKLNIQPILEDETSFNPQELTIETATTLNMKTLRAGKRYVSLSDPADCITRWNTAKEARQRAFADLPKLNSQAAQSPPNAHIVSCVVHWLAAITPCRIWLRVVGDPVCYFSVLDFAVAFSHVPL